MSRTMIERDSYITPDGIEYVLTTNRDRVVFSWEGEGMPPIEYITQRGPFQHGETVLNYFLRPRVLQAVIRHQYCDRAAYWAGRANLLDVLRPNRQSIGNITPGRIRKRYANGEIRDLNVFIESGPAFAARSTSVWDEQAYQETLRFIAFDPVWFHPTQQTQTLTLAASLVTFRAAASGNTNNSTANAITVATPAGVIAGDYLLAGISVSLDDATIATPAGWTLIRGIKAVGSDATLYVFSRVATASEPVSHTWSLGLGQGAVGIIVALYNQYTIAPLNVENGQVNASSATQTAPNVTTTSANCLGILFATIARQVGTWSTQLIDNAAATEPASGDVQNNASSATDDITMSVAYRDIGAAQAVNTNTAVCTTAGEGAAWIGAVAPAAAVQANVVYTGNWIEYPILIINGPIVNPVILNVTTGEQIALTLTLTAGQYVTIDLRYGIKTVTKSDGSNQIGTVSDDSDLASFHLAPDPEATDGINVISLSSTSGDTGNLQVQWYRRYIGL